MLHTKFMTQAIEQAQNSGNDIPVGVVIVYNNKIIAAEHNQKEAANNATFHAEILAINAASLQLNTWRLEKCNLYVTLEPCPMCAWAILQSRISNVYFGAYDNIYGAFGSALNLCNFSTHNISITGGICESECSTLLKNYMSKLRNNKYEG